MPQKFEVGGFSAPHLAQSLINALPHCAQKLLTDGLFVPHFAQRIATLRPAAMPEYRDWPRQLTEAELDPAATPPACLPYPLRAPFDIAVFVDSSGQSETVAQLRWARRAVNEAPFLESLLVDRGIACGYSASMKLVACKRCGSPHECPCTLSYSERARKASNLRWSRKKGALRKRGTVSARGAQEPQSVQMIDPSGLFKLRPISFRYKQDPNGALQYGLVAEEVAPVYPELVTHGDDGKVDGVRYELLPALLLNEVQKLAAGNKRLAAQIDALKKKDAQMDALAERMNALEQQVQAAKPERLAAACGRGDALAKVFFRRTTVQRAPARFPTERIEHESATADQN